MEILRALKLTAPLILSQLSFVGIQLINTYFVSKLGTEALAGLVICQSFWFNLQLMGVGCLIAADSLYTKEATLTLWASILVALLMATLCVLGSLILTQNIPSVKAAGNLLLYLCMSLFFMFPYIGIRQFLLAQGKIYWIILLSFLSPGLQILFFNLLPHTIDNVGLASVFTQATVFTLICFSVQWKLIPKGLYSKFCTLLKSGLPYGLQLFFRSLVFSVLAYWISKMSSKELAVHGALINIANLFLIIPFSFSSSASILIAQSLNPKEMSSKIKKVFLSSYLILTLTLGVSYLGRDFLLSKLLQESSLVSSVRDFILFPLCFVWIDSFEILFTGVFRGILITRLPFGFFFLTSFCLGLPLAYVLGFACKQGLWGIWASLLISSLMLGGLMLFSWKKRRELL